MNYDVIKFVKLKGDLHYLAKNVKIFFLKKSQKTKKSEF